MLGWWHWTYIIDYILTLIIFVISQFLFKNIEPRNWDISSSDTSIGVYDLPNHHSTFPNYSLVILSVAAPLCFFFTYNIALRLLSKQTNEQITP